ncbi:kinase-like domain-containing protein [Entophlyctis helioformis]|nr:kinase-like domain-containing protein [Entophlyctis helioformis]
MLPRKPTNMIYRIFHLGDSTPPETADDDDLSGGNSSGGASGSSGAAQKQAAFLWGKSRRHYNSSSDFDSDEDHSDDSGGSNAPSRKPSRKSSISEAMDSMIRRAGSMTARSKPASHQQPQQPPQHQQHPQQQQSNQQSQTGDLNQLHVAHANTSSASSTSTIHAPKLANRQPSKKGIFSMGNSEEESSDYESEHEDASPKKTIRPSLFKDLLNGTRSKKQTSRPASPSISRGNSESNLHHREDAAAASPFSLEIPPPEHNSTPKQESHHNIFKDLLSPRIRKSSFSSSGFASASASGAASATSSHGSLPRLNGTAVRATESGPTSPVLERKNSSMSLQRSGSSEVSLAEKYGKTEDILGRGAYATVKLCCPMNSKQKFAIKEFRKRRKDESQKEYVKKLIAEFCISSTLDHENVVRTVDLIQDAKHQWCVVMEYCAGGDLYCRISNGSLKSYSEMSCYFAQLVHGVQYLHSMGVSHRDLKPENLILDASGRILKITDFGVSQVFRTPFGTVCKKTRGVAGSGPYIAPEEFCSEEYDSEAVDVWSMGIIYFVMAANSIPWRTAVASDQRYKYFLDHRMHYAAFERLQPGPRSLVYKLIEPDPVKRIKVADLLEDEWLKSVSVCTALNCNSVDHVHESHSGKA